MASASSGTVASSPVGTGSANPVIPWSATGTPSRYPVVMAERGYTQTKDDYLKRLRRVEGQIRGLQRMVEEDTYCIDVLTQVAAATKALQSVAVGLLDEHVRHCVRDAAAAGDGERADEMVTEATRAIERLVKA